MFQLDFTYFADTWDCLFPTPFFLSLKPMYNMIWQLQWCTISILEPWILHYSVLGELRSLSALSVVPHTLIRRRVVLFKPVTVPTPDPKSEFLCQSSSIMQNLQTPPKPPSTPGIAPTPLSSHITLTPMNQVLSQSTLNRNYASSMLNILVAAT